uniref:Peptidase S9 prolyl oligopeptidase catalytic domain-containing protein n=1 Tax=Strigamia maritima TaxID=126957 RepID=T1JLS4_STRMM
MTHWFLGLASVGITGLAGIMGPGFSGYWTVLRLQYILKGMHKYDYGKAKNQKLYKSPPLQMDEDFFQNSRTYTRPTPPAYDLRKISVPVALFHSANDAASDPLDVELLSRNLNNLKAKELIPHPMFCHADFATAMNMKHLVYDKFIGHAKEMWNNSN